MVTHEPTLHFQMPWPHTNLQHKKTETKHKNPLSI